MPRRAAARRRSCGSGRMRPIVMPSSHHPQLILSGPNERAAENAGVRKSSARASCVVPGETASVISFINGKHDSCACLLILTIQPI
jgi:hypothetical protein